MKKIKKDYIPKKRRVCFRVTTELYDMVAEYAALSQISVAEILRRSVFSEKIVVGIDAPVDLTSEKTMLEKLEQSGEKLNAIAHLLNAGEYFSEIIYNDISEEIQNIFL